MSQKNSIAVRIEGGLGDCLLSTRFIPAIREYHTENSDIIFCYDNNRNESYQLEVIKNLYPSFYDDYVLLDHPISGVDLPLIHKEDLSGYNFFYNLKIDDMEWTKYNFNWLSRFYYFPKPEINLTKKDYICLHLTHNKWAPKNLDQSYITEIIKKILQIHPNIIAITTDTEESSYREVRELVRVYKGNIVDVCKVVGAASIFLTIDSGFKYIAYAYGVPTLEIADHFIDYGVVHPMIHARWLPYPSRGLPLYTDPNIIKQCLQNILENRIATLYPYQISNQKTFNMA